MNLAQENSIANGPEIGGALLLSFQHTSGTTIKIY